MIKKSKGNFISLLPFLIFIFSYLGIGLFFVINGKNDGFYMFKSPIAVIIGIIFAFILISGDYYEKISIFLKGCGDENIILMCMIYLLAGAFSNVSSKMGGVEATVNLGINLIPASLISLGVFLIACFISLSTWTSVGTIVALGPIAVGFAEKSSISLALIIGTLISGAMFGDNLSVISDTTIAATRTQGVNMRDKFKTNLAISLPAMAVTVVLLLIFARPDKNLIIEKEAFNFIKVLPYIFVLITAISGVNVFIVLTCGIIFSGIIGIIYGDFSLLTFTNHIYDGFTSMFEIFLLSMLTGGLASLVKYGGGLDYLISKVKSFIKSSKSAEFGIGLITLLTDAATANNTVAIIVVGPVVRQISEKYKVDPRRSASLMDIFSAVMQGFIPYGAQVLMAVSYAGGKINVFSIMPYLWYQFALLFFAILSIFIPYANSYINNYPWDFEKWDIQ